jgi:hypothetical protein
MHTLYLFVLGAAVVLASPVIDTSGALAARDSIPNCDDTSQTYAGQYTDNEGTYVTSDGVTHPWKGGLIRKCWWDYFLVSQDQSVTPWEKSSGDFWCTGTQSCHVDQLNSTQICQTHTVSISAGVSLSIEGFGASLGIDVSDASQQCITASDTTSCTWSDGGCHTVWTQQPIVVQNGYRRQRCNYGHGDQTQCLGDWTQTTPYGSANYGCGSQCSDTNTCGHTDGTPCS